VREERPDAIVVGGGAAGLSCALFLARANCAVTVFDDGRSSLHRVSCIRNYLGLEEGVSGSELLARARRQVERCGVSILHDDVIAVRLARDGRFVAVTRQAEFASRYLVLASNKRTDLASALGLALGGHGGRFVATNPQGETGLPRCYAAGRITGAPSQAIVSAGDGARVALAIIQAERGEYYVDHDT
jgi:thioredoxin reductase (NADPH)